MGRKKILNPEGKFLLRTNLSPDSQGRYHFLAVFAPQKLKEYGSTILRFSLICCMEWAVCAEKAGKNAILSLRKVCSELKCLGKMEILEEKRLKKWKYYASLPWKNGNSLLYNIMNMLLYD